MLNRKCLFGGGLCLGSSIAIFASISSDVIAMEAVKAKNSIHDFRSELNQIVWSRACSEREFDIKINNDEEQKWILNDKYKDSRTKVIGKAIGDCVAREGAFANKRPEDIITFKDTDPKTYKQRNWNAVILYNYIHEMINGEGFEELFNSDFDSDKDSVKNTKEDYAEQIDYRAHQFKVENVLKNKLEAIKEHYKKEFGKDYEEKYCKRLDKAVEHIQKYVSTLPLIEYLYDFKASKQKYDGGVEKKTSNLAPDLAPNFDEDGVAVLSYPFYHADKDNYSIKILEYPSFECINGELYISVLGIKEQKWEMNTGYFAEGIFGRVTKFLTGRDNSSYSWNENQKDQMWFDYKNIYTLEKQGTWIAERLKGLAQIPTKEVLDEWVPLTDNGEENEQNN